MTAAIAHCRQRLQQSGSDWSSLLQLTKAMQQAAKASAGLGLAFQRLQCQRCLECK